MEFGIINNLFFYITMFLLAFIFGFFSSKRYSNFKSISKKIKSEKHFVINLQEFCDVTKLMSKLKCYNCRRSGECLIAIRLFNGGFVDRDKCGEFVPEEDFIKEIVKERANQLKKTLNEIVSEIKDIESESGEPKKDIDDEECECCGMCNSDNEDEINTCPDEGDSKDGELPPPYTPEEQKINVEAILPDSDDKVPYSPPESELVEEQTAPHIVVSEPKSVKCNYDDSSSPESDNEDNKM